MAWGHGKSSCRRSRSRHQPPRRCTTPPTTIDVDIISQASAAALALYYLLLEEMHYHSAARTRHLYTYLQQPRRAGMLALPCHVFHGHQPPSIIQQWLGSVYRLLKAFDATSLQDRSSMRSMTFTTCRSPPCYDATILRRDAFHVAPRDDNVSQIMTPLSAIRGRFERDLRRRHATIPIEEAATSCAAHLLFIF